MSEQTLDSLMAECLKSGTSDEQDNALESFAQMAETADRFPDMMKIMKSMVKKKVEKSENLKPEQRNLLSVAYKNVVGALRQAWRVVAEPQNEADEAKDLRLKYKAKIEAELKEVCDDVLALLQDLYKKLKDDDDAETKVFYLKMRGDYFRYLTEVFKDSEENKEGCEKNYKEAMDIAEKDLPETHPTRLGLALNFSVCYYEILDEKQKACDLAKQAFDSAIEKLDSLNDNSYKDSTLIMQLLRDNLTIWNSPGDDDNGDEAA